MRRLLSASLRDRKLIHRETEQLILSPIRHRRLTALLAAVAILWLACCVSHGLETVSKPSGKAMMDVVLVLVADLDLSLDSKSADQKANAKAKAKLVSPSLEKTLVPSYQI